ncbi:MAG: cysteine hydrolase family protein [Thermodesulfobacteriota bacterium]
MNQRFIPLVPSSNPTKNSTILEAEPEPLEIDLKRTAVVVVDMQNALISKGGMIDLLGVHDVSKRQKIIAPFRRVIDAIRQHGSRVVYTVDRCSSDLRECGGPDSPFWYKSVNLSAYRDHPEWRDKLLIRGTWGSEIVNELMPLDGDIIVESQRLSTFFGTNMDMILKMYHIKYLLFGGITTNIAVEGTMRDAFYLDYFPILMTDCAMNSGPPFMQEATAFNLKYHYGWITNSEAVIKAFKVGERL